MIKTMMTAAAVLLAASAGAAAQSSSEIGQIEVSTPWARASAGRAGAGAAYFEIRTHGSKPDRLMSAKTGVSRKAEFHTHLMKDNIMRMVHIEGVDVPAGGHATLKPGGHHVMLMGLKNPLMKGHSFPLSLTFEKAGTVTVDVVVMGPGSRGPKPGATGHKH